MAEWFQLCLCGLRVPSVLKFSGGFSKTSLAILQATNHQD